MSSTGSKVSRGRDLKSCATTSASRSRGTSASSHGATTTPSSVATATRSSWIASPTRPRSAGSSPSCHGTAVPTDSRTAAGDRRLQLVDPVEEVAELEAPERLLQRPAIGRCEHDRRGIEVELEVAPHRREPLRRARLLRVLDDVLPARRRELVGVRDHLFDRAVLRHELPGGLVADPGDPRDVVRRVALEPDEVRDLVRADAVPRLDALGRVDVDVRDAARRHHQADRVAHELERVAVGGDDARAHAGLLRARGEGRDHVVGLPPLELEVPVAERLHDRPEVRELLAQEVGHRPPVALVGVELLVPVDRARVPRDRDALRPVVGEELEEHVGESEQRVRREALGRRQLLGQREEGAVGEVVAVDEEQLGLARRPVVELQLRAREGLRAHEPRVSSRADGPRARPLRRGAPGRGGPPAGRDACAAPGRRAAAAGGSRLPRAGRGGARTGRFERCRGLQREPVRGLPPRRAGDERQPRRHADLQRPRRSRGRGGGARARPVRRRRRALARGGPHPVRGRRPCLRCDARRRVVPGRVRPPVRLRRPRGRAGSARRRRRDDPAGHDGRPPAFRPSRPRAVAPPDRVAELLQPGGRAGHGVRGRLGGGHVRLAGHALAVRGRTGRRRRRDHAPLPAARGRPPRPRAKRGSLARRDRSRGPRLRRRPRARPARPRVGRTSRASARSRPTGAASTSSPRASGPAAAGGRRTCGSTARSREGAAARGHARRARGGA